MSDVQPVGRSWTDTRVPFSLWTMKAFLQSVLLCLSGQVYHSLAKSGQCHPPQLDNGVVEAEEGDAGNFFKGEFRCNPGFTLSGPTMLKCRNGVWSGNKPVCSVSGCDPKNLPNFVNGRRLRVKGTRDSLFKYKCTKGFRHLDPRMSTALRMTGKWTR